MSNLDLLDDQNGAFPKIYNYIIYWVNFEVLINRDSRYEFKIKLKNGIFPK